MIISQIAKLTCAATTFLLAGCATIPIEGEGPMGPVEIVEPFEYAAAPPPVSMLGYKIAALAELDPDNPLAGRMAHQTLSLFGREDLIASVSSDYQETKCAATTAGPDVFAEIKDRARRTSIVIINESHERSQHRGFTAEIVTRLRPLGYNTLAIETLINPFPDTQEQYLPPFVRQPDLPYFEDEDGFYLSEAAFGRLGRLAKMMQYRLFPYEAHSKDGDSDMPREEQIADREERQASNLAALLREHPDAKLIVHVGYSHAAEVPQANGARWMAARLKEKTGIDPLTISQTTCRGADTSVRFSALPDEQPARIFDLVVDHPQARFERNRPVWRKNSGDQLMSVPTELHPSTGWRIIEARPVGEPVTSVPMDRVAIRPGENVALLLPPGRYALRVIDASNGGAKPTEVSGDIGD